MHSGIPAQAGRTGTHVEDHIQRTDLMYKRGMALWILRIAGIIEESDLDPGGFKLPGIEVASGTRAGYIMCSAREVADFDQTLDPGIVIRAARSPYVSARGLAQMIGRRYSGPDTQPAAHQVQKPSIDRAQVRFASGFKVGVLQFIRVTPEVGCAGVVLGKGSPMPTSPALIGNFGLINALPEFARSLNRYGEPRCTVRRFYPVPITPVILGELDRIQEDKLVHRIDQVEVSLPGEVIGLQNGDHLAH